MRRARLRAGAGPAGMVLAVAVSMLVSPAASQETNPERTAAEMITPAADRAIERGLELLASRQQDDGSFGTGMFEGNTAITGLAGLAFMCGGSTPGRGPHGGQVDRCIDYLLASAQESGLVVSDRGVSPGPMYDHGFATMFLAECYGMSQRAEMREKLTKAVKLIVATQNKEGGWRYRPQRLDADISVTVCEVMALRAARNAGIHVPKETIERSIDYVKRCQNPDGGFMYMLDIGSPSEFARSAAGVVALYSAGVYQGPEIKRGLDYVSGFAPREGVVRREKYYYYGHYYAVQAMWLAGGRRWSGWYPAVRDELIARQREDGSWMGAVCSHCETSMALIVLQVPNNCVPIFQR